MFKMVVYLALSAVCLTHAAVLDPALYLSPSPPLTGEPEALDRWSEVPAEPSTVTTTTETSQVDDLELMTEPVKDDLEVPQARTFWPLESYGGIQSIRGIHIPLTFTLTGSYGSNGMSTGVIGSSYSTPIRPSVGVASSYASLQDEFTRNYGKSGLAGSSYGLYRSGVPGTRVYGGSGGVAWSGWGNGKWGHYGKGSYGTNGMSTGVIGSSYSTPIRPSVGVASSYASLQDEFTRNYGKSGLAGSSYGLYRSGVPGTRVYGGSGGVAWSGWGNGKWGHYGKGYGSNGMSTGVIGSSYSTPIRPSVGVASSYASLQDEFTRNYGKSILAGSSYGLYRAGVPGTRVYGGSGGVAWSGWGNGKWGHYGKG